MPSDNPSHRNKSQAVAEALEHLSHVWPKKFAVGLLETNMALFGDALASVRIDCVVPAAKQWVNEQKFAPTPAELAALARKVEAVRYPKVGADQSTPLQRDPDLVRHLDALHAVATQLNKISYWLVGKTGSLRGVSEVMGIVWQRCQTDEDRARVRRGDVTKPEILLALTEWQRAQAPQS
jgi:hypothetical protein